VRPTIELLELPPRVEHVLSRHGYETIESVDQTPDDGLLLLSNMDARSVREIRRAITLWKYRRWQENGFAATGDD
jgi:DNA-directed RNA polymerase alpha subunit